MRIDARLMLALSLLMAATPLRAQDPLSAIDWLSQSVSTPAVPPAPATPAEPQIAGGGGALPVPVVTSSLDGPRPDAAGTISAADARLPRDLWGIGRTGEVVAMLATERAEALPALQGLLRRILLAEVDPPADAGGRGDLLLARVDKLLSMGLLADAEALIEASGKRTPALFRRRFDVALLTGTEGSACAELGATPDLAPTYPARIFCIARSGDWNSAALTLRVAQALQAVTPEEDALLTRYLDPDIADGGEPFTPPSPMTPLVWQMLDAIGEGLPTANLPLAFSHAELRDTAGWKAQIEAAERLARVGAIGPDQLLAIYVARLPAASGGVWDRVEAFQQFETALGAGDPGAVAKTLPAVWAQMMQAELEVPFARLFADRLQRLPLGEPAAALAFRIALLSPDFARAAARRAPADATEAFLIAVATGNLSGVNPPDSLARAVAPAFLKAPTAPDLAALLAEGRKGEALLGAIDRIITGLKGDTRGVAQGLSLLRAAGLDDVARATALELLLLERRG